MYRYKLFYRLRLMFVWALAYANRVRQLILNSRQLWTQISHWITLSQSAQHVAYIENNFPFSSQERGIPWRMVAPSPTNTPVAAYMEQSMYTIDRPIPIVNSGSDSRTDTKKLLYIMWIWLIAVSWLRCSGQCFNWSRAYRTTFIRIRLSTEISCYFVDIYADNMSL